MNRSLILTLYLNKEALEYFTELRSRHFPPERNYLNAHLTLFHYLPDNDEIISNLQEVSSAYEEFEMIVSRVAFIGNGVAFRIESNILQELHLSLQHRWQIHLKPQDRQKLWPHITIQNKSSAETAHALYTELSQTFSSFPIRAEGMSLWEYLSGPWKHRQHFSFRQALNKL